MRNKITYGVIASGQENQLCPLDEKHLVLFLDKNQLGTYLPWETLSFLFFFKI